MPSTQNSGEELNVRLLAYQVILFGIAKYTEANDFSDYGWITQKNADVLYIFSFMILIIYGLFFAPADAWAKTGDGMVSHSLRTVMALGWAGLFAQLTASTALIIFLLQAKTKIGMEAYYVPGGFACLALISFLIAESGKK